MVDPRTSEKSSRISGEKVDTKLLGEEIVLPFSGRKAKNRFMKAPMTERMCEWPENHQEDVVCIWKSSKLCLFGKSLEGDAKLRSGTRLTFVMIDA